jgi:hypothetical protein
MIWASRFVARFACFLASGKSQHGATPLQPRLRFASCFALAYFGGASAPMRFAEG